MKTTIDIHDELLGRAKRHAEETGQPSRVLVEDARRSVLAASAPKPPYRLLDRRVWRPDGRRPSRSSFVAGIAGSHLPYPRPAVITVDTNVLTYAHRPLGHAARSPVVSSLPLNRAGRLVGDVVNHAGDAGQFVDDAIADAGDQIVG